MLKKSLPSLQKTRIYYVRGKDSKNKATVLHCRNFCKIHSTVKLGIAKVHKLHLSFLASCPVLIEVSGNFALMEQSGGLGLNYSAICQNNQVTGNCSSKGRCVSKFQMPAQSWCNLHTLGHILFSGSTHSLFWC